MSGQLVFHNSELVFGHLGESRFSELLKEKYPQSRFIVLTDENVAGYWMEYMLTEFEALFEAEIIQLPSGEEGKNIETCISVWEALSEYKINRQDVIINFGGGVVTDMGGFIASTFKRGLRFINIPTTLLAQVDASLGGKTGIDLAHYKNQVGVFADPEYVFIDPRFLATLDHSQLLSGYAEMLKHALIADAAYWKTLTSVSPDDLGHLLPLIQRSVEIKKTIVEKDYHEKNIRKTLNFGHTIGHALESYFLGQNKPILHGYAVAYGMVAEAYLSHKMNLISEALFAEIRSTVTDRFGELDIPTAAYASVKHLVRNDKKNSGGKINFVLLNGMGSATIDQHVDDAMILSALEIL